MTALVTLLSLLLLGPQAQHGTEWTYSDGVLDEAHWPREYPDCGGKRQSPIDLQREKVWYNPSLRALNLSGYEVQHGAFLMINNGHTVQISLPPTMCMTAANGTQYIAQQMHFHWGGASLEISGSEHTIDGIRYVMEIHVVHYNSKYKSYDKAQKAPDGLAVLAALVEVKDDAENTYYSNFISHLKSIRYPGQSTVLRDLDVQDMLPGNLHYYYSYWGSLTTPPCTENVHWFVLADTVKLSRTQVWKLENSLLNHQNKTIHNDYRGTQTLNNRVVEANFMSQLNQCSELQFYPNNIDSNLEYSRRFIEQKKAKRKRQG
ncbi:carbonic anhydrase 6 [Globicephala melas]|uniref:carbonic anhydrase 6 n=2 Tax=Delphinidae TaxID=9726 RepID=UPI00122EB154|nr:carbonic anhydrase 6 isoform X2 [Globicephala melas]XP_060145442.1 carbonic anhydrase 6 [Globicephala melas]